MKHRKRNYTTGCTDWHRLAPDVPEVEEGIHEVGVAVALDWAEEATQLVELHASRH